MPKLFFHHWKLSNMIDRKSINIIVKHKRLTNKNWDILCASHTLRALDVFRECCLASSPCCTNSSSIRIRKSNISLSPWIFTAIKHSASIIFPETLRYLCTLPVTPNKRSDTPTRASTITECIDTKSNWAYYSGPSERNKILHIHKNTLQRIPIVCFMRHLC